VEAETEMAMVAVMAPIRANEENPAKERLRCPFFSIYGSRSFHSWDTADDGIEVGQIHGLAFRGKIILAAEILHLSCWELATDGPKS